MHAATQALRHAPLFAGTLAALASLADAFVRAQRMRRECERWERSGRPLDGDALRRIWERLEGAPGAADPRPHENGSER